MRNSRFFFVSVNNLFLFQNLGNWDDTELKKLLDEAITYKRPKDREHKSETFKVTRFSLIAFRYKTFVSCGRNCFSTPN